MSYKLGTVCVGQHFKYILEHNDMECVIIKALSYYTCTNSHNGTEETDWFYQVKWASGRISSVKPKRLRIKRDPKFDQFLESLTKLEKVV